MTEMHYTLQLNAKVQPLDRGDIFEDPISEVLEKMDLGEVDGGGSLLDGEGGIQYCDVEIYLKDGSEENRKKLLEILEKFPIPKGSFLKYFPDEESDEMIEIPVGNLECICLSLNGFELDDEVYKNSDINKVIDDLIENFNKKDENLFKYFGYAVREKYTDLYFYGTSFEEMKKIVEEYVPTYPLCEKSIIKKEN
ncbi:hypothetical protein DLH72_03200 [Candidatus Gracilibacteria bacterium]|nr:MAG: hypothetical protein DLH72_03200 [Candidatus Gracilibacteria bacterium]